MELLKPIQEQEKAKGDSADSKFIEAIDSLMSLEFPKPPTEIGKVEKKEETKVAETDLLKKPEGWKTEWEAKWTKEWDDE